MEYKSLGDYDNIKEFLQLLDDYGMQAEKKNVEFIIDYVDNTENKFNQVLNNLDSMKAEINKLQDRSLKSSTIDAVNNTKNRLMETQKHILNIKKHIVNSVNKAIKDVKLIGKDSLTHAMQKINVRGILKSISKKLHNITNKADRGIDDLSQLANEIYNSKGHIKNAGRAIIGKKSLDIGKRDTEKGILLKIQTGLFKVMEATSNIQQKTDKIIHNIENRETEMNQRKVNVEDNRKLANRISSAKEQIKNQVKNKNVHEKSLELN